MEKEIYWFWLNELPKMTAQRAGKLLVYFEDAQAIYQADAKAYRKAGIREELIDLLNDKDLSGAEVARIRAQEKGIRYYTPDNPGYPEKLKNIYDRPLVLYTKGEYELRQGEICVAIVGTRNATRYGIQVARSLAYDLARRGIVIVSGMALGIDSAAHKGAIEAGGKTIAVLGTGVNRIYPKSNTSLYYEILNNGCAVSEYELDMEPQSFTFPPRNRIISGLSAGSIVVEAGRRSGAIITAHAALEQNREVFAVPGSVLSPQSEGTNRLIIKNEAKLVRNYRDVLDELQFSYISSADDAANEEGRGENEENINALLSSLKEEECVIFEKIRYGIGSEDELAQACKMNMPALKTALTMMEINGVIVKNKGKFYIKI